MLWLRSILPGARSRRSPPLASSCSTFIDDGRAARVPSDKRVVAAHAAGELELEAVGNLCDAPLVALLGPAALDLGEVGRGLGTTTTT
jgi:hypothetical protein